MTPVRVHWRLLLSVFANSQFHKVTLVRKILSVLAEGYTTQSSIIKVFLLGVTLFLHVTSSMSYCGP